VISNRSMYYLFFENDGSYRTKLSLVSEKRVQMKGIHLHVTTLILSKATGWSRTQPRFLPLFLRWSATGNMISACLLTKSHLYFGNQSVIWIDTRAHTATIESSNNNGLYISVKPPLQSVYPYVQFLHLTC
jgi:hypothetical protein